MPLSNFMNKMKIDIYDRAVSAGFMIGFAALLSCHIANQYLAALFFSIGLLYIRITKAYLFTGQVQNLKNKTTTLTELFIGLFGNLIGVGVALLIFAFLTGTNNTASDKFILLAEAKWNYPWYHYFLSGICCGVLMTIATKKESPLWLSIICVAAFILAGFNHCIADWFYIGNFFSHRFFLWLSIMIGNFVGGYLVATK